VGYKSRLYHIGKWRYYLRARYHLMMSRKMAIKVAKRRWLDKF
jgi:hypothetical protein